MSEDEALASETISATPAPVAPPARPIQRNGRQSMKKRSNAGDKRRRNAARSRPRHRNAGYLGFGGRPPKPPKERKPEDNAPLRWQERVWPLVHTTGAAFGSSYLAAQLARSGIPPKVLAVGLGLTGGLVSYGVKRKHSWLRDIANGVASAGTSQAALQWLAPEKLAVSASAAPPATRPPSTTLAKRNVNMGELPPHALEDAFHRAQAELAITHDPYASTTIE